METSIVVAAANNSSPDLLSQISTAVQIAFFGITGLLAIFTYLTAKKTVFQPLRTEIFKVQIEDLGLILKQFSGRGEVELREEFAFKALIIASIALMYDAYVAFAFNMTRPEDRLEYRHELCPSSAVLPEALEFATEYRIDDPTRQKREKPKEWKYMAYEIPLPKGFSDKQDEFQVILDSPLLPKSIVAILEKYLSIVEDNIGIVRGVIKECAEEMPAKYPELDDIGRASYSWIEHRINRKFLPLEPTAKMINEQVRAYFDSDNLLPAKVEGNLILRNIRNLIKHG